VARSHQLADLLYAIMRVLWGEGEASVARVQEALGPDRARALTTIATMLAKMEKKGVVAHRTIGRQFLYRAKVSEGEVRRSMVGELTRRLFRGDAAALVNHLLTEEEIDPNELERLRAMIAERTPPRPKQRPEENQRGS
jgi:predicted transcriptional regulator